MRWIKKLNDTFYDGHNQLYHHAKFGEDRTTRAGCRCKNVVFVTMFVFSVCHAPDCAFQGFIVRTRIAMSFTTVTFSSSFTFYNQKVQ